MPRATPRAKCGTHQKCVGNICGVTPMLTQRSSQREVARVNKVRMCHGGSYRDYSNCSLEGELSVVCSKIAATRSQMRTSREYLSVPEKGSIQHNNDIDDVAEMESDEELAATAVVKGGCECSPQLRRMLKMKVTNCNMKSVARVILQSETDGRTHRVTFFDKVLTAILRDVPGATVSKRLLCTPLCQFTIK